MPAKYNYSILNDFPNSMVNLTMLTEEINSSTISGIPSHINAKMDNCDIWFDSALVSEDETELDGVVATHSGAEPPEDIYFPSSCYAEAESLNETFTTSTNFVEVLSLSIKSLPPGQYRAGWSFEWSQYSISEWFLARVQFNDTDDLFNVKIQPTSIYNNDQWNHLGGFARIDIETLGDYTLDIDLASTSQVKASYIRNARLELWRIP